MGKYHVSFRMHDLFPSGPRSSCHPCPCGRRLRARPSAERGIRIWSSCAIEPLPHGLFWVQVDKSNVCPVIPRPRRWAAHISSLTDVSFSSIELPLAGPFSLCTQPRQNAAGWTSCLCLLGCCTDLTRHGEAFSARRPAEESYPLALGVIASVLPEPRLRLFI